MEPKPETTESERRVSEAEEYVRDRRRLGLDRDQGLHIVALLLEIHGRLVSPPPPPPEAAPVLVETSSAEQGQGSPGAPPQSSLPTTDGASEGTGNASAELLDEAEEHESAAEAEADEDAPPAPRRKPTRRKK